jgi:hypothetical protein
MSTRAWTNPDTGHTFITVDGDQVRIDALPRESYRPAGLIGAGHPATPCPLCRYLRGLTAACSDRHLFVHPVTGRLRWRICGSGRYWATLIPVYRGELPGWPNGITEHHSTGAAA